MISLLVLVFFAVVATGPDGMEWMAERRRRRDFPLARQQRVLPPGECPVCHRRSCQFR